MRRHIHRRRRAFTLLEVMLVLAILLILASFVGVSIIRTQSSANVKATQTQLSAIETILKLYYLDMGAYPTSLSDLRVAPQASGNVQKWNGPYSDKDIPPDPWGNAYLYEPASGGYRLWSAGPDALQDTDDDIIVDGTS